MAGVSRATAARVFSAPHLVAEATREAVLKAAETIHYRPNLMARGLAGGRTNTIGVLWSLGGTPVSTGETRLMASELEKHGLMPYITEFNPDDPRSEDMLGEFARRGFDGVVIQIAGGARPEYTGLREQVAQFRATVLVSDQPLGWDCDEVTRDRLGAYREAARHFARTGRHRPALARRLPAHRLSPGCNARRQYQEHHKNCSTHNGEMGANNHFRHFLSVTSPPSGRSRGYAPVDTDQHCLTASPRRQPAV